MLEQDAIDIIEIIKDETGTNGIAKSKRKSACNMAIRALTKQIPVKPLIIYGEPTNTHNLGRLMQFSCPSCKKHIVAMYETDVSRGGGISKRVNGCSQCLQAIDFSEWYYRGDEINSISNEEDIEFED